MHELSVAENILEIVKENLSTTGSVKKVKVRIGKLANIIPDSLEFCFDAITRGTVFEGAKLEIEGVNIVVRCESCGVDSEVESYFFQCKKCGNTDVKIVSGNELRVVELEIEDGVVETK
jgi:hydrogenase nickel incorporation protein HypA/HybF